MNKSDNPLACYIAAVKNKKIDAQLDSLGFSKGLISFSIPDLGIQFRCRTDGDLTAMELSAFFSLLEFISTKLAEEKIKSIKVMSSLPEFVFAFTPHSDTFKEGSSYRQLLDRYAKKISMAISYVPPQQNKALISPADYPSLPDGKQVSINIPQTELTKSEYKPFQKGIKL